MAQTTQRNQHHRPPQTGGAEGRGAVSPLGGRSNPDRTFRGGGGGGVVGTPLKYRPREEGRPIPTGNQGKVG